MAIGVLCAFFVLLVGWIVRDLHLSRSERLAKSYCIGNLIRLRLAKNDAVGQLGLTNGNSISVEQLLQCGASQVELSGTCPAGGMYILMPVGVNPRCTYTNSRTRVVWKHWYFAFQNETNVHEW